MLLLIIVLAASFLSVVVTYLAVMERDLLISVIYIALLGVFYSLMYYVLMAPDVITAYIPISSILLPIISIVVLKKTKRYEE